MTTEIFLFVVEYPTKPWKDQFLMTFSSVLRVFTFALVVTS